MSLDIPTSFSRYYIKSNQVSSPRTRATLNNFNLYTPRYQSNHLQRSIKYQGIKGWNEIPLEISFLPKIRLIGN